MCRHRGKHSPENTSTHHHSPHPESGVEPHAVGLEGVHPKRIKASDPIRKRLLQLEVGKRRDELILGERAHDGRDEAEVGGEAGGVGGAVVGKENALGLEDQLPGGVSRGIILCISGERGILFCNKKPRGLALII